MVFTFLENSLNLGIKCIEFLKKKFPQQQKGVEKNLIYFIKIQSQKMKMT